MVVVLGKIEKKKIIYSSKQQTTGKTNSNVRKGVVVRVYGMRDKRVWWYSTKVNVVLDTLIYPNIIMERKNTTTTTTKTHKQHRKNILQTKGG